MNTYAVKSSAHRAAKQAGLSKGDYNIVEIDGKFGFEPIPAEAPTYTEPVVGEFSHCPHCATHLDNGYSEHACSEVNGKVYLHKEFMYQCLACGGEFGPAIPVEVEEAPKAPKAAKAPIVNKSTVELPTKLVWHIADEMFAANPATRRKDVIAACVERGIAFYTARTQYQQWLAVRNGTAK